MTLKEAYEIGVSTGYDIGRANLPTTKLRGTKRQEYIDDCAETEGEHFRQFSPFEFTAQEFNEHRDPDNCWDHYDAGVYAGIKKAVARHNKS